MRTFIPGGIITLAVMAGLLLTTPDIARAQQKQRLTIKSPAAKFTQQHLIDVGDIPGHQLRVFENQVTYDPAEAPRYEGVRVVETWGRGQSDYTNGTGSFRFYATDVLENGDKIFWQGSGTTQTIVQSDGTRKTTFHSAASTTSATGKMRGIRGVSQGGGSVEFREGKAVSANAETLVEYWFE